MNYLAHALLSGDDSRVLAGNLLADVLKGPPDSRFHPHVLKGIVLHRKQDVFADSHEVFKRSRRRLNGVFRHYSGVIVDVFYDHLLATNFSTFSDESLDEFVSRVDDSFLGLWAEVAPVFTPKWKSMLWLNQYATLEGIGTAFERIAKRSRNNVDLKPAIEFLDREWDGFEEDFLTFFPDAIKYTGVRLQEL